ncbi:MAG TPA: GspH/FimT family pseudopilin [Accumulibacter sp.]|nr:GspH/FimT family pseudopilin [Accumulibacter sp.]HQC81148.1 GspH/FimT family pseudopilin [Accumulibacter sp.]
MKTLRGFSLIELVIGILILGVLMTLAMPAFTNWLRNTKVRTATESVQNGLQLARAEAVRRNSQTRFSLVTTLDDSCALANTGPHWVVSLDGPAAKCATAPSDTVAPRIVQSRGNTEGSATTKITGSQSAVIFNGLGRPTPVPAGNVTFNVESTSGDSCMTAGGPVRCLRVVVTVGGQIRMCDPALPTADAQGC